MELSIIQNALIFKMTNPKRWEVELKGEMGGGVSATASHSKETYQLFSVYEDLCKERWQQLSGCAEFIFQI